MKVAVVGSRSFTDYERLKKVLDDYFIHGEAGTIFDYNQVLTGGR